jgi:hypothetical protein
MALDVVFKHPAALRKFRCNPFYDLLEGYCQWLLDQRYARTAICANIFHVRVLTKYLVRRGVTKPGGIGWDHVQQFMDKRLHGYRGPRGGRDGEGKVIGYSVTSFCQYLISTGVLGPRPTEPLPYQSLLDEYITWLENYRHLNARTVEKRRRYLVPLLDWVGVNDAAPAKFSTMSPAGLQEFLLQRGGEPGSAKAVEVACSLRVFLTFCFERGYLKRNLAALDRRPYAPGRQRHQHGRHVVGTRRCQHHPCLRGNQHGNEAQNACGLPSAHRQDGSPRMAETQHDSMAGGTLGRLELCAA